MFPIYNITNKNCKLSAAIKYYFKKTYPCCVRTNGTSMLCDALRRSPPISANLAKSVSRSWSANRADRRDSNKRTSSRRFFNSNGGWNKNKTKFKFYGDWYIAGIRVTELSFCHFEYQTIRNDKELQWKLFKSYDIYMQCCCIYISTKLTRSSISSTMQLNWFAQWKCCTKCRPVCANTERHKTVSWNYIFRSVKAYR